MNPSSGAGLLHKLAHLYGVQTAYYDVAHRRCQASPESLLAILKALGAPIRTINDAASALRLRRQDMWQCLLEPVTVAWHGDPVMVEVRLPATIADALLVGHLTLESGEQRTYHWPATDLVVTKDAEVEGVNYVVKQLTLLDVLPWGYHRLTLQVMGISAETFIIVAPIKAYTHQETPGDRRWGVFLPLYALKTEEGWESGSYSSLKALIEWVSGLGGGVVATLPLLATFLDEPFEPSPYAPISRLLWNEFYLDITRVPELSRCPSAQAILNSSDFGSETYKLYHSAHVDYRREMAMKRQILEELCQSLFTGNSDRLSELSRFADANPLVEEYAGFRATLEKRRGSWRTWPQRLRNGVLREGDYNEKDFWYHLYVQWLTHQQVETLSTKAREKDVALYLDLPLGVHPDGYDAWREQSLFDFDVSVGAPPDVVFTAGQDWNFSPPHPDKIREQGYKYTIAYLRHHLQYADILRIDHVMGLHRFYCIPKSLSSEQGVYIRYRSEELYAILSLESHRYGSIIVGEDLGTVPREVRPAMSRHGLHRMYVMHYELQGDPRKALRPVSNNYVASLNNHDMPTFTAFWQGLDIELRLELGFINKIRARREQKNRERVKKALVAFIKNKGWISKPTSDSYTIMRACLSFLSSTEACVILVNLEDLWQERKPQNIPSSGEKYPNWRRKAKYRIDEFCQMPQVLDILQEIGGLRKL